MKRFLLFVISFLISISSLFSQSEETFTFEGSPTSGSYYENGRQLSLQNRFQTYSDDTNPYGIDSSSKAILGNKSISSVFDEIGGFYMYYTSFYLKRFYIKVTDPTGATIDTSKDIYLNGYHFSDLIFHYKIPKDVYNTDPKINNGFTLIDLSTIEGLDLDNTIIDKIMFENKPKEAYVFIDNVVYTAQSYSNEDFPLMQMVEVSNIQENSVDVSSEFVLSSAGYTERGFVYSTIDETPTEEEGATMVAVAGGSSSDVFTTTINNMEVDKIYYVRAYAKNSNGTRYSFPISTMSGASSVLRISSNNNPIPNNSTETITDNNTDLGSTKIGETISHTYTIANIGNEDYTISTTPLLKLETLDGIFGINEPLIFNQIAADSEETFTISANHSTPGIYTNTVKAINGESIDYSFNVKSIFYKEPEFTGYGYYSLNGEDSIEITSTVKPNFSPTSIRLDYGLTISLGNTINRPGTLYSTNNTNTFKVSFPIIQYGTAHYYRFTATNAAGDTNSSYYYVTAPTIDPVIETNDLITLNEGETKEISNSSLLVNDPNNQHIGMTIQSLPSHGEIQRDGETLAVGDIFTQADIDNNLVSYVHDGSHTTSDQMVVVIRNDKKTLDPTTIQFSITTENDPPVVIPQTRIAEKGLTITFTTEQFSDNLTDEEGDALEKIQITTLPTSGDLKLDGVPIVLNQEIPLSETAKITYVNGDEGTFFFMWKGYTNAYSTESGAVSLVIGPDNTPPTITSWSTNMVEDNTYSIPTNLWTDNYSDAQDLVKIALIEVGTGITVTLNDQALTPPVEVLVADLDNLKVVPDPNYNGAVVSRWDATDGANYTDGDKEWTVSISAVDDIPTAGIIDLNETEDTSISFTGDQFGSVYDDVENDGMTGVVFDLTKLDGVLALNGVDVVDGKVIPNVDISDLTYTPKANVFGSRMDTLLYRVQNTNGESLELYPIYVSLSSVNDKPTNEDFEIAIREDESFNFSFDLFNRSYDDVEQQVQEKVKITTLPTNGKLTLLGNLVVLGQEILKEDIMNLRYAPKPNRNGTGFDSFQFQSSDGIDYSSSHTVTIHVTSVADLMQVGFFNALHFTGNGYVEIPHIELSTSVSTIEFLVKTTLDNTDQVIVSSLSNNKGFEFGVNSSNQWYIKSGNGTTTDLTVIGSVANGASWKKVQIVTGANAKVTVLENENQFTTIDVGVIQNSDSFSYYLGKSSDEDINYFKGAMDELTLWNIVRTVDQAKDIYASYNVNTPNLVNYWNCDAIESFVLKDQVEGNIGTIQGNLYFEETGKIVFHQMNEEETLRTGVKITDWDSANGAIEIVSSNHGVATIVDNYNVDFTAKKDFSGIASFTYKLAGSSEQKTTQYIEVINVDDAPVAIPQSVHVGASGTVTLLKNRFEENFSDADNDPLEKIIVKTLPLASQGVLRMNGVTITENQEISVSDLETKGITFTKEGDFSGTATFNWNGYANGKWAAVDAYINLIVSPKVSNLAISDNRIDVREDEPYPITKSFFADAISNGENVTHIALITSPENGYFMKGDDVLTTPIQLMYSDLDDQDVTLHFNANWNGTDSFRWDLSDDVGYTDGDATATVVVAAVNDAPEVTDITMKTKEDVSLKFHTHLFRVGYSDVESDDAQYVIIESLPIDGALYYNDQEVVAGDLPLKMEVSPSIELVYAPLNNSSVNDTLTYRVQDSHLSNSVKANLAFEIEAVNDAPDGSDLTISMNEDEVFDFLPSVFTDHYSDVENDALGAITIVSLPGLGTLTYNGTTISEMMIPFEVNASNIGLLKFVPTPNGFGEPYTSFDYKLKDDNGAINGSYNITVSVVEVADAPSITEDVHISMNEDNSYIFSRSIFDKSFLDVDNHTLKTVKITTIPTNGSLSLDGVALSAGALVDITNIENLVFEPKTNLNGQDITAFEFKFVNDQGVESTDTGRCIANIRSVNDAPVITDSGNWSVTEGEVFTHTLAVMDYDNDGLLYSLVSGPAGMTINNQGVITWNADVETNRVDGIVVSVTDGEETVTFTTSILINNVNNKVPVVTTTSLNMNLKGLEQTFNFLLKATDADFGTTSFTNWTIIDLEDKDRDGVMAFSVDSSTGIISISDYDELFKYADHQYDFKVTVSDGTLVSAPTNVSIVITDDRESQSVSGVFNLSTTFNQASVSQIEQSDQSLVLQYESSNGVVATVQGHILQVKGVGTSEITVSNDGNKQYKPYSENFTFTVAKGDITVTARSYTRKYQEANPVWVYDVVGAQDGDSNIFTTEPTITSDAIQDSGVGVYNIEISAGISPNYNVRYFDGNLTIEKAEWSIIWSNQPDKLYINEPFTIALSDASIAFNVTSADVNIIAVDGKVITGLKVGSTDISITIPGDINHETKTIVETVTVYEHGNTPPTVDTDSETLNLKGLDGTETIQLVASDKESDSSALNGWELRYLQDKDNDGTAPFALDAITGVLSITDLDELFAYGTHDYTFQVRVRDVENYSEWKDVTISIVDNRELQSVTASFIKGSNYSELTVTQVSQSDASLVLEYVSSNVGVVRVEDNVFEIEGVGSSEIAVSNEGNNMYKPYSDTFTFTVAKGNITVTAKSYIRKYQESNPVFEYEVVGAREGDRDLFDNDPTISTTATVTSNVGSYALTLASGISSNYDADYIDGTLTIERADRDIVWSNPTNTLKVGESLTVVLSDATVPFTVTSSDEDIVSVMDQTITALDEGSATITVGVAEDQNYHAISFVETITVTKPANTPPTVDTDSETLNLKGLDGTETIQLEASDKESSGSSLNGWELRYLQDKDNDGTAPFALDAITGVLSITDLDELFAYGTHDYTFQVRVRDVENYSEWKDVTISIVDNRELQSVTASFIKVSNYSELTVTQVSQSDASLVLEYVSSNIGVVRVEDNVFEIEGVGSSEITVSNEGNNMYKPYSDTFTFTVAKGNITVTAKSYIRKYQESNPVFEYEVVGAREGDRDLFDNDPTISTTATVTSNVGSYVLTLASGISSNYDADYIDGTLTIERADRDIVWSNPTNTLKVGESLTVVLSDATVPFTVTSSDEDIVSVMDQTITALDEGSATITVEVSEDQNYHAISFVETITVTKPANTPPTVDTDSETLNLKGLDGTETIQLEASDKESSGSSLNGWELRYLQDKDNDGTAPFALDAITGVLSITDLDELFAYGTHDYTFQVRVRDVENYSEWKDVTISIVDNRELQSVTASFIKGSNYSELTVTQVSQSDASLVLEYVSSNVGVVRVEDNVFEIEGVGSSEIAVSNEGNNMYKPYSDTFTFTVAKGNITVTAKSYIRKYQESNPVFEYEVVGAREGDRDLFDNDPTISTTATVTSNVGSYALTLASGISSNYDADYIDGTLTIERADRDIVWSNPTNTLKVGESLTVVLSDATVPFTVTSSDEDIVSVMDQTITALDEGSATITVEVSEDQNYHAISFVETITVTKPANTPPTVDTDSETLNLKGLDGTETIQLVASDKESDSSALNGWELRYLQDKDNDGTAPFALDAITGVLSITDLDELFAYGTHDYTFQVRVRDVENYSEWKDVTISIVDNRELQSVTASFIKGSNYSELTVTQVSQSDASLALEYVSSNVGVVRVEDNVFEIEGVGSSEIAVSNEGNNMYKPYSDTFTFTVAKGNITVTAKSYIRKYQESNPVFEYEVEGAREGDSNIFGTSPTLSSSATLDSDVGTFDIEITPGISPNYNANYTNGTLTIERADRDIVWSNPTNALKVGESLTVVLSDATVPFTVTSSDEDIVSVMDQTITALDEGSATITVGVAEDQNYHAISFVETITVTKPANTPPTVDTDSETLNLKGLVGTETIQLEASDKESSGSSLNGWQFRYLQDKDYDGNAPFALHPNSGVLSITDLDELFKYGEDQYDFQVRVSDGEDYSEWTDITIYIVDDRNEQSVTSSFINEVNYRQLSVTQIAQTDQNLTLNYSSDNIDVVSINGLIFNIVGAGTSLITVTNDGNTLYKPFNYTFTFDVAKASATVRGVSYTRKYQELNPIWGYDVDGAREGDNIIFTTNPILSSVATKDSDVGKYDIVITPGVSKNYDVEYIHGTLTIEKAEWNVTWTNEDLDLEVGQTLDVELSQEVDFSLVSADPLILQTINHTITAVAEGTVILSIIVDEDENHKQQIIQREITVIGTTGEWDSEEKVKIYPNPASDFLEITGLKTDDKIFIYDSKGRLAKTVNVEDVKVTIPVQSLIEGVYLLRVNRDKVYKIIIKR
ncbi:tandem-95 repeat protein [Halosquirtibacter laminarini]|uniref:Tandem-95 repeat protein n=1 Tax=Halosquirtibacter laminarini TaxID=3374600 RepID=A0AC61NHX3_9BACT|nr:tandem-95 repeat protein [Prolixibacteraceae bacterium]